jgi:hypothetical protein
MKHHRKRILAATGIAAVGALVAAALIVVPALATTASGVTALAVARPLSGLLRGGSILASETRIGGLR